MYKKYANYNIPFVDEKEFKYMYIDEPDYKGYLSQIHILKSSMKVEDLGEYYKEWATDGCKWLEFYPENSNIAMTVCYNKENKILNWYFDAINKIGIEEDNPYFEDLYLDLKINLDNEIEILDEDELQEALESEDITQEQYDIAKKAINDLFLKIDGNTEKLKQFSDKYFRLMNQG